MTAENVFKWARVYRLYYAGKYDFKKYKGGMKMPPLIKQPDRVYYYKIAGRLTDAQIHALFLVGFFHNPSAHISDLATPKATAAAVEFCSRGEGGQTVQEHTLYDLSKQLAGKDLDAWLYGEWIGKERASMPECVQSVIKGELPLDTAALLLLIPQPEFGYNWMEHFADVEDSGLGLGPWLQRLKRMDQLLVAQRPGWRMLAFHCSGAFWKAIAESHGTLQPKGNSAPNALFA
jgi:hypothetical protein